MSILDIGKKAWDKPIRFIFWCIGIIVIIGIVVSLIGFGLGWFGAIAEEYTGEAYKEKLEWFQNTKATCDRKIADIELQTTRLENWFALNNDYNNWSRFQISTYQQYSTELMGLIQSYNQIASQYNAEMVIWYDEWANPEVDPDGVRAQYSLPHEYKPYIYEFPIGG